MSPAKVENKRRYTKHNRIQVTKEELEELYLEKQLSGNRIAEMLGASSSPVYKRLKMYNIPIRSPKEAEALLRRHEKEILERSKHLGKEMLRELYIMHGLSISAIAKQVRMDKDILVEVMKLYNIPLRSRSESGKMSYIMGRRKIKPFVKDSEGHILVHVREKGESKGRYVQEHRLIWESVHNRPLPKGYVIHHLNGIKSDNRPENLIAMKANEHLNPTASYKKRIRELEAKIKILEKALDSEQLIWWSEN